MTRSVPSGAGSRRCTPRILRGTAALFLAAIALLGGARTAHASGWSEAGKGVVRTVEVAFDLTILRPLNAAALALGSVFFVASAPIVAPFGGIRPAWDVFVYAPYEYAFEREPGDF